MVAGRASAVVDADAGGRLAALTVDGLPLLFIAARDDPMQWGSYPMVPWAGRIRDGRFTADGSVHQLPRNLPPHSAHGTGFTSRWSIEQAGPTAVTLGLDLGPPWPFGGRVTQRFELDTAGLTATLTVVTEREMPAMVGWHPWFNRHLTGTGSGGETETVEARLRFAARSMYELDDAAIPTGRLVTPPPGPWDNCFTGVEEGPVIEWPGLLELRLTSSCDHWVIYTEPEHALCVEPQTAAPDLFNRERQAVPAGGRLEAWFRIDWA
jgi:aldose 1-epimerase